MDIKQQITMTKAEIKNILLEHLARKGYRINEGSYEIKSDDSLFVLTLTEEEIFLIDTNVLLKKPISLMELEDVKLKKKLIKRLGEDCKIGTLLITTEVTAANKADFTSLNHINGKLLKNSESKAKDKITVEEQRILIKFFGDLGIKLREISI